MKAQNILIALIVLSTSIVSNTMNKRVQLPSEETLKTYLQEYLPKFRHEEPEGTNIPKKFGNTWSSPQELKNYLSDYYSDKFVSAGIFIASAGISLGAQEHISEVIRRVFQEHPSLLEQIKAESNKNKKF